MADFVLKIHRIFKSLDAPLLYNRPKMSFFHPKRYAMFINEYKTEFQIFAFFSFGDMVDFVLKTPSELGLRRLYASTV